MSTDLTHKFVAVLNKKAPIPKQLNALAHMAAGLVGGYSDLAQMRFSAYRDADGVEHPSISDHGFIILQADNANQLRTFRNALSEREIPFTDFTSLMTVGTYLEQHDLMASTKEADLEYWGICTFASKEELDPLTKKFSLWK